MTFTEVELTFAEPPTYLKVANTAFTSASRPVNTVVVKFVLIATLYPNLAATPVLEVICRFPPLGAFTNATDTRYVLPSARPPTEIPERAVVALVVTQVEVGAVTAAAVTVIVTLAEVTDVRPLLAKVRVYVPADAVSVKFVNSA
ncbi:unannotated protein [freshwater metagenome]|uniref:Unannotated protein n=1 Tax=freshwater metagenome TaxID=449393 RepID=A0A6J6M402_9ZZZZ